MVNPEETGCANGKVFVEEKEIRINFREKTDQKGSPLPGAMYVDVAITFVNAMSVTGQLAFLELHMLSASGSETAPRMRSQKAVEIDVRVRGPVRVKRCHSPRRIELQFLFVFLIVIQRALPADQAVVLRKRCSGDFAPTSPGPTCLRMSAVG